jgi:hypothetical protein
MPPATRQKNRITTPTTHLYRKELSLCGYYWFGPVVWVILVLVGRLSTFD